MDGFRIATVSDIHLGPLAGRAHTERIVAAINRTQADIVAVVGDLVDGSVRELGAAAAPLRGIQSRHGAFFVTGNHEYYSGAEEWLAEVERLGIRTLRNQRQLITAQGGAIDLAGVNDLAGEGTSTGGPDIAGALRGRDPTHTRRVARAPARSRCTTPPSSASTCNSPGTRTAGRWCRSTSWCGSSSPSSAATPGSATPSSTSPTAPASGGRRFGSARHHKSPLWNFVAHKDVRHAAPRWTVTAFIAGAWHYAACSRTAPHPSSRTCTSTPSTPAPAAATSTLPNLALWARRKGVTLLGTGDFTHPAWYDHLKENLQPAEPGLFRLSRDAERAASRQLPPRLASTEERVRFTLSVEISTIYKRDDRTRKVHHLIYLPDLDAVARFNTALGRIGNLASDGRPILGLDSRDLLEITLEASPDGYLVPAHIWTPWFSALGSKSGFDAIADCYADLADHIFAVETGLSSDPAMNWRVSSLDRYQLVSNSDAHSPPALAREATVLATELDYYAVRDALRTGDGLAGTLEFFPEEGKYHADGHRLCGVNWRPEQTRAAGGLCPECHKPLTDRRTQPGRGTGRPTSRTRPKQRQAGPAPARSSPRSSARSPASAPARKRSKASSTPWSPPSARS